MLSTVLPGLRHVRTPLIVGWLYFTLGWVLLGPDRLLMDPSPTSFTGRLAALVVEIGVTGTIATLSFLAYLLGSFLLIRRWPIRVAFLKRLEMDYNDDLPWHISILSRVIMLGGSMKRGWYPLVMHPVFTAYRADGFGTDMAVRVAAGWADHAETWAAMVSERFDHQFTYADLDEVFGGWSPFRDCLEEIWRDDRNFLLQRANNEFSGIYETDSHEAMDELDYERPDTAANEAAEFSRDHFRSRHLPPWEPSATGWETNVGHEWWDPASNRDETVKDRYIREALLATLDEEVEALTRRLRVEGSPLYDEYDRRQSEAELRYSMVVPLVGLVLTACFWWTPLALLAFGAPIALVYQGFISERDAQADLYAALRYGVTSSPTVDLMEAAGKRFNERGGGDAPEHDPA